MTMKRPILWIHEEALGPANPALRAWPEAPAIRSTGNGRNRRDGRPANSSVNRGRSGASAAFARPKR